MLRFFERLTRAFPAEEPSRPPSGILGFCRYHTRGMEGPLIGMTLISAVIAITEVALFGFLGQLVDWLVAREPGSLWSEEWQTLLGWAALLLLFLPALTALHALLVHQSLLGNYPMRIRWQAHRYLLRQSLSFYQNEFAGRIATKVMQTALAVRETVMKLLDVMVYVNVYFLSMMVLVASADWRLALPMLAWLAAYIGLLAWFVPRLRQAATLQADARADMTGRIVDSYTNIATVKLFSHSQREATYAREGMQHFLGTVHRQMRLAAGLNMGVHGICYLLIGVIAAQSLWLWSEGLISTGTIAVAISLALRLDGMAQWIMWEVAALFENLGTVTDGAATLSAPREITDAPKAAQLRVAGGAIQFRNVQFHYGKGSGVLDGLNLNIQAGEKVGLVGRSGAGKSTLINLLLRFHDVESGSVEIDGQDVRAVSQESLRANIAVVTQDTALLHRSVRENILYGRPDGSEADMRAAAEKAEAHEFIQQLSDPSGRSGYDALVGERGVKLSGGQRQRIAIARVLLKNAPILVLDEATSALDSEIEAVIQESLRKLMDGKTVLAIAHRLSTIAALDRLVVLDEGRILEQGTHEELLASGGIYARLWARQTGGFLALDPDSNVASTP